MARTAWPSSLVRSVNGVPRTISRLQHKTSSLGPLVDIGIRIYGTTLRLTAFACEPAIIVHAPIRLKQIVHGGDALADIDFTPTPPESVMDGYRAHRNVSQLRVW